MIKFVAIVVLAGTGMCFLFAADQVHSPIPLEKGTQWIYEAKVRWTPVAGEGPPGVKSERFKWTTEIVESFPGKSARAAVIHAWPDEVGSMDPAIPTNYSVLLESNNRLYRLGAKDKPQAIQLARQLVATPKNLPFSAAIYLDLPLTLHKRWGEDADDPKRTDGWYCWHVETRKENPIRITGVPRAQPGIIFTVAFRTLPSHELIEIAPGIGIVRYEFEHHGTVASADVRLVEFKPPPRSPSVTKANPSR